MRAGHEGPLRSLGLDGTSQGGLYHCDVCLMETPTTESAE
jgi:hypothetical protein